MPVKECGYPVNRSKEWTYWQKYYEDMGCGYNKVMTLSYRKMNKLYSKCKPVRRFM